MRMQLWYTMRGIEESRIVISGSCVCVPLVSQPTCIAVGTDKWNTDDSISFEYCELRLPNEKLSSPTYPRYEFSWRRIHLFSFRSMHLLDDFEIGARAPSNFQWNVNTKNDSMTGSRWISICGNGTTDQLLVSHRALPRKCSYYTTQHGMARYGNCNFERR